MRLTRAGAAALVLGVFFWAPATSEDTAMIQAVKGRSFETELSSLSGATAWLNAEAPADEALRGKVVLINFWTYTCINWLRQLPHIRAWAAKYADQGLVVIGVHTPEFEFEKDVGNVRLAARALDVGFPIAIDSDYSIWSAFDNHYWPALYIIDAEGRIRHQKFGEGGYEEAEAVIQKLLAEAGAPIADRHLTTVVGVGAEAPADWDNLGSPETYLGYERSKNFASARPILDRPSSYAVPASLPLNYWGLAGDWIIGAHSAELIGTAGRIAIRFHARDVHLVMAPAVTGQTVRFRVFLNGQPPGAAHGIDADSQGVGAIVEPRLYQLIRQDEPVVDQTFEIEFLGPGAAVFAFTFG